jgi:hypothetical protein
VHLSCLFTSAMLLCIQMVYSTYRLPMFLRRRLGDKALRKSGRPSRLAHAQYGVWPSALGALASLRRAKALEQRLVEAGGRHAMCVGGRTDW